MIGQASIEKTKSTNFFAAGSQTILTPKTYGVQASQNVFRGFRSVNEVKQAKSNVKAERHRLVDAEQQIMVAGVSVYMDVIRDLAVRSLRENNVQVLTRQLQATRDRFEVGEITRTDVAQAEARLSGAKSGLIEAEAGLTASRVGYQRVIGNMPGTLEEPPALPPLPATEEEALALAIQNNPVLRHTTTHNNNYNAATNTIHHLLTWHLTGQEHSHDVK